MYIHKGTNNGSSYHQLFFHFVWTTYKRNCWIDEGIEKDIEILIRDKVSSMKSELMAFGCISVHVHLLVKLHPTVSLSEIVGEVKGYTSYVIANQINPGLGFRWQGGYGALSVSSWDLSRTKYYIHNQKEHHQQESLIQERELPGE